MALNQQGHFTDQKTEAKIEEVLVPPLTQLVCAGAGNESQDFGLLCLQRDRV